MLDIKIIRENPEDVKTRLKGKQVDCDMKTATISLRSRKNSAETGKRTVCRPNRERAPGSNSRSP